MGILVMKTEVVVEKNKAQSAQSGQYVYKTFGI